MSISISAEDPRSIKAISIAAGARQWLKCHTADGAKAYGIPSTCQPGRFYLVTSEACDCEDFKRHGLTPGRVGVTGLHTACKHVLAVRLHCELAKAQHAQPKPRHLRLRLVASAAETARLANRYSDIFSRF